MKKQVSFALLPLIIIITIVRAQNVMPLHFKSININDGLSQGFISGITQDRLGLMWFATGDGLNKYDGYNFTVYHHDPDDSASIGSDDLTFVFEDSKQRLWVCTRNNGIDYFDRANGTFYHIRSAANGLRPNKVSTISEDSTGALYISTDLGFDRLELKLINPNSEKEKLGFLNQYSLHITHIQPPNPQERGTIYTDTRGRTFYSTVSALSELVYKSDNSYACTEKFKMPPAHADFILGMLEDKESYSLFDMKDIIERWGNKEKFSNKYIFPILENSLSPLKQYELNKNFVRFINNWMKHILEKAGIQKKLRLMLQDTLFQQC